tara:strand:- start:423 stop:599 length:177 start_codon:yes stop_codon:yes gene_type:complete
MQRVFFKEKKIKSLITKHQEFDIQIQKALKKPSIDDLIINDLKKKKLKIRDEISRLKG